MFNANEKLREYDDSDSDSDVDTAKLLQQAIADGNPRALRALLSTGISPNLPVPDPFEEEEEESIDDEDNNDETGHNHNKNYKSGVNCEAVKEDVKEVFRGFMMIAIDPEKYAEEEKARRKAKIAEKRNARKVIPPLLLALALAKSEIADMLLSMKAVDPYVTTSDGRNALLVAVEHVDKLRPLSVVVKSRRLGLDMKCNGWTALAYACFLGRERAVELLIKEGAYVEATMDGATPLAIAATEGHEKVCEALLKGGARINAKSINGSTALCLAAKLGHSGVGSLLLSHGASHSYTDNQGRSPLYLATEYGHHDFISLLIDNGADMRQCAKCGCAPMDVLARTGDVEASKVFLARGCDPPKGPSKCDVHVDKEVGHTALTVAYAKGNVDVGAEMSLSRWGKATSAILSPGEKRSPHHWAL